MSPEAEARLEETLNDVQATLSAQGELLGRFSAALADQEDRLAVIAKIVGRPDLTRPNPARLAEAERMAREMTEAEAQVRAARMLGEGL